MAQANSGGVKVADSEDRKGLYKCRIPRRLGTGKQRLPQFKVHHSRSKLANGMKDEVPIPPPKQVWQSEQSAKEKLQPTQKRPLGPYRTLNGYLMQKKIPKPFILVPVTKRQPQRTLYTNRTMTILPDQETIDRYDHLVMQQCERDSVKTNSDLNERESVKTSRDEEITQLKINWQENIVEFEKMKSDLDERQKTLMELYATLGFTGRKMAALGQKMTLPDELQVMNVAHLTPEQLLKLCANTTTQTNADQNLTPTGNVDMDKLYNMPSKLVETCKETLNKRKEIIDTFVSLTNPQQSISRGQLLRKVREFNAENEMFCCSLEKVKNEFFTELNDIVSCFRKSMNEKFILQEHNKQMSHEITELHSQKDDLRKKLHEAESKKPTTNRREIKELEKQLKEEQSKRNQLRDRLSRAEGQLKTTTEKASQLQAALEQSRSKNWSLERTVQELREENQKLKEEFETELNKLTHSIKENTSHLEEIAEAKKKLQSEKEDLEKRLADLSENYNDSIKNMKKEINSNVAKVIELEKKYDDEKDERLRMEERTESLYAQLCEIELRYKDMCKKIIDKDLQISKNENYLKELEAKKQELITTKTDLESSTMEIESCRKRLAQQKEAIKDVERKLKEALKIEEELKSNLRIKEEYIAELEKKEIILEQQLKESDCKMVSYEIQLTSLKHHINQLQQDFGEFENLSELNDKVNQQRLKLHEVTRQNNVLAEALQKKELEIKRNLETISEQEDAIEQRNNIVKILTEREEEHTNIIKLLRSNLEKRTQADVEFNEQISEKNAEIDTLRLNLETKEQEINQLEKIILTLEDQIRNANAQRRKDKENLRILEGKVANIDAFYTDNRSKTDCPTPKLDIIKILEDELGTSLDENLCHNLNTPRQNKADKCDFRGVNKTELYDDHEKFPTKMMGRINDEKVNNKPKANKLDHKRVCAVTETQKWVSSGGRGLPPFALDDIYQSRVKSPRKNLNSTKNLNYQMRDEKMFKIASHKLQ